MSGWGASQSGCHASRVSGLGVQVIHTYIDIILKVILGKVLESLCSNVFDLLQHFQSCALSILNPNKASKTAFFTYLATWVTELAWPTRTLPKGRFFKKGLVWQFVFVQPKLLA